jgi:hypothetical protein
MVAIVFFFLVPACAQSDCRFGALCDCWQKPLVRKGKRGEVGIVQSLHSFVCVWFHTITLPSLAFEQLP